MGTELTLMIKHSSGFQIQAIGRIGAVPSQPSSIGVAEVKLDRNFMMFNGAANRVPDKKIHFTNGPSIVINRQVPRENGPAEKILQQGVIQLFHIETQEALRLRLQTGRKQGAVSVPGSQGFPMLRFKVVRRPEYGCAAQELPGLGEPAQMSQHRLTDL